MSPKAQLCRACATGARDKQAAQLDSVRPWFGVEPDYSGVPEDFFRAFAGFFMGEGSINIKAKPFTVLVDVALHTDNRGVLTRAQSYFGGSVFDYHNHPISDWRLQGLLPCRAFLTRVRDHASPLGAIKTRGIDIALAYIEWRLTRPHHLSDEDKAEVERWRHRLVEARKRGQVISA